MKLNRNALLIIFICLVFSACSQGDSKEGAYEYAASIAKEAFSKPLGIGVSKVEPYSNDSVEIYVVDGHNEYRASFNVILNNGQTKNVNFVGIHLEGSKWKYTGMHHS